MRSRFRINAASRSNPGAVLRISCKCALAQRGLRQPQRLTPCGGRDATVAQGARAIVGGCAGRKVNRRALRRAQAHSGGRGARRRFQTWLGRSDHDAASGRSTLGAQATSTRSVSKMRSCAICHEAGGESVSGRRLSVHRGKGQGRFSSFWATARSTDTLLVLPIVLTKPTSGRLDLSDAADLGGAVRNRDHDGLASGARTGSGPSFGGFRATVAPRPSGIEAPGAR